MKANSFGRTLSLLQASALQIRERHKRRIQLWVWMQCDISLHCACKLDFKSPSLAYPCVYFSCSSNALTLTSVPLAFPSSRHKARNAEYSINTVCGASIFFFFMPQNCTCSVCTSPNSSSVWHLDHGVWWVKHWWEVTPSSQHQIPGEISGFSFSLLDKRAGETLRHKKGSWRTANAGGRAGWTAWHLSPDTAPVRGLPRALFKAWKTCCWIFCFLTLAWDAARWCLTCTEKLSKE